MKITPAFLVATLAVLSVLCWLWLLFITKRREEWTRIVDRENNFWVNKGLVPSRVAEAIKRFEQGGGNRLFVGIAATASTLCLIATAVIPHLKK